MPPKVKPDSRLEALLEVTADTARSTYAWEPSTMRPLDLRLDEYAWNEGVYDWDHRTAKRLIVLYKGRAGSNFDNDAVNDVLLDGKPSRTKKDNENFRLLVAICRQAHAHRGCIDIQELADDSWVWSQRAKSRHGDWNRYVRVRLRNLKKYHLGQALLISEDECYLTAKVRCQAVQPASGSTG